MIIPATETAEESSKKKRKKKKKTAKKEVLASPETVAGKTEQESDQNGCEISKKEISKAEPIESVSKDRPPIKSEPKPEATATSDRAEKSKKRKAAKTNDSADSNKPEVEVPLAKKPKAENVSPETVVDDIASDTTNVEKRRKKNKNRDTLDSANSANLSINTENGKGKKKKKTKNPEKLNNSNSANLSKKTNDAGEGMKRKNKNKSLNGSAEKKFKKTNQEIDPVALLSSERLKAYGLNPKKFKNKLKYGNK